MMRLIGILVSIGIVGMSQGLIVPLLALILERRGASAAFNGLSTTALFLGIIIASPFIERTVRRYGARRTILYSIWCAIVMTLAFPLWTDPYAWIAFRLVLGIALAGLFVATEIWLNQMLTSENRGRVFAFYGLAIGIGLMLGPQGINLAEISEALPFLVSAATYLIPLILTWRVNDDDLQFDALPSGETNGLKRWGRIFALAPFAMGASFVYGYLDGALVGDFPIYGARLNLTDAQISWTITIFVIGSIALQLPLGYLSDRWGRRKTLLLGATLGLIGFLTVPAVAETTWLLMAVFFFIGGVLGSFYSLGLAYLGDLVSGGDLPTGNVLYTMVYGVGSLLGPSVTGFLIFTFSKEAFAWSIATVLVFYVVYGVLQVRTEKKAAGLTQIGS